MTNFFSQLRNLLPARLKWRTIARRQRTANVTSQEAPSVSEEATTTCEEDDDVDDSEDVLHVFI